MATWKSKNILLTAKGKQLLSLLQNAEGSATITKVITGAGRVSESELPNITEVINPKLPCSVISKEAYDTGSILNLQVSNENLDNTIGAYEVNQVGVYMRHPDIDSNNEFLYMIAQCDEGTADHMPLPQVTPITLNYALYLLHGNGTEIEVTLDATAGVPMSMFQALSNLVDGIQDSLQSALIQLDEHSTTIIDLGDRITILEGKEDLTPRVVALENDMEDLKPRVKANEDNITSIFSRLSTAETNISSLQSTVKSHASTLTSHSNTLKSLDTRISTNASRISAVDEDLTVLEGEVDAIKGHPSRTDNPHNVTIAQLLGSSALAVTRGGTGRTSLASNSILIGNGTNPVALISNAKGALFSNGADAPVFATLPVEHGGTGMTYASSGNIIMGGGLNVPMKELVKSAGALYCNGAENMYGILPVNFGGTGQKSISYKIGSVNDGVRYGHVVIPGTDILVCWGRVSAGVGSSFTHSFSSSNGKTFKDAT